MADQQEKPTEITTEKENVKVEDSSSDDEQTATQNKTKGAKKTNKGEKKFKKAMAKLGLKTVEGFNRVTIKKSKAFFLYIDEPEVMQTPGADNTYVVFGEAKIQDFSSALGQQEASHLGNSEKAQPQAEEPKADVQATEAQENKGDDEDVDAGDLTQEAIDMVINHVKCTRAQAIKALKNNNGDSVSAIIELTS